MFAAQATRSKQYLVLGVARAHRSLRAVLRADEVGDAESASIQVRVLCEVVVRSLWIGLPDDADERELRRRSYNDRYYRERLDLYKRWGDLSVPVDADDRRRFENARDKNARWFEQKGKQPLAINIADIANGLGLGMFYPVYKESTDDVHWGLGALVDGIDGDAEEGAQVPLDWPDAEWSDVMLGRAIALYVEMLRRAEPTLKLGLSKDRLLELLA